MIVDVLIGFLIISVQETVIVQVRAADLCEYRHANGSNFVTCPDDCCAHLASSEQNVCCKNFSWGSVAITFCVIIAVFIISFCLIYCRPLLKQCFCCDRCPCANRARVTPPGGGPTHDNPVFIIGNDDLPDYDTITKDTWIKESTPPAYNFVTDHATDFGIEASRVPSAPPQYRSRPGSAVSISAAVPVQV